MANEISTTFANRAIDWLLATGSPTRPSAIYVGLGTGSSATGLSGELSGNGYARQLVTFSAAASRTASNSVEVRFGPNTTTNWGTVSHVGLFDASTGGNCIAAGSLDTAKSVTVGDEGVFSAGNLDFTISAYAD